MVLVQHHYCYNLKMIWPPSKPFVPPKGLSYSQGVLLPPQAHKLLLLIEHHPHLDCLLTCPSRKRQDLPAQELVVTHYCFMAAVKNIW